MKAKKLLPAIAVAGVVTVALLIGCVLYLAHTNDLGLTGFDVIAGERPDVNLLRTNTQTAANSFLAQHKNDLVDPTDRPLDLVVDYSKTSRISALGYRSSFYYYCWNVYVPYSLRAASGKNTTVVVQVSDATPGHGHDPQHFHVIRYILLDATDRVIKESEAVTPGVANHPKLGVCAKYLRS